MTLSTKIYVHEPIDGPELHKWVNERLLNAPNAGFEAFVKGEMRNAGEPYESLMTVSELGNTPGQGLPAWFILEYDDAPFKLKKRMAKKLGSVYAMLDFDTSYNFRMYLGGQEIGCTELHAEYIYRLATEYLNPRHRTFSWVNEYSGEVVRGLDDEAFKRFLGAGTEAHDWFQNIARPAITAEVEKRGAQIITWAGESRL